MVTVDGLLDADADDAMSAGPPTVVVDAIAGCRKGLHEGVRGPGDLSLAPRPDPARYREERDADHEVDRLPANGVEAELLVEGEIGGGRALAA